MEIREQIRAFMINNFLFGEDSGLKNDTSFLQEGMIDSTGILELVSFLENQFCIVVEDEELMPDNLDSINKIAAFVEKKAQMFPMNVDKTAMVGV
ncbi:MAG: acyl carrier protein [Geobacter sp.]|nr:MAG: acyl carrier protein [Geobacter sp.]